MSSRQVAVAKALAKRQSKSLVRESTGSLSIGNHPKKLTMLRLALLKATSKVKCALENAFITPDLIAQPRIANFMITPARRSFNAQVHACAKAKQKKQRKIHFPFILES